MCAALRSLKPEPHYAGEAEVLWDELERERDLRRDEDERQDNDRHYEYGTDTNGGV